MKKLRILTLYRHSYPEITGGGHIYMFEAAKRLAARGHDVHILCASTDKNVEPHTLIDNIHFHRFYVDAPLSPFREYAYITRAFKIAVCLHQERPFDLVNVHGSRTTYKITSSALFKNVPYVYTFHADRAYEHMWDAEKNLKESCSLAAFLKFYTTDRLWYAWFHHCTKKDLEHSSRIIVLSDYVRAQIERGYGHSHGAKIRKIPSGIDTERFAPADDAHAIRRKLRLPEDRTVFLTVRRLVPRMGFLNLVEGVRLLCERKPDLRQSVFFSLVGKGPLGDRIQRRIEQYGLSDVVRLEGYIDKDILPKYYQAADCFILPTEQLEGFGIVTIEALACGIPVIATPRGASVETVGTLFPDLLCETHTPEGLADKIAAYVTGDGISIPSPEHCRRLALERFSWDAVIPRIEQVMYEAVKKSD